MKGDLKINPRQVFVIMPFQGRDNIYLAIKQAIEARHYIPIRGDEKHSYKRIFCKICTDIQCSKYIIGDISEYNPNVYFELGMAFAIGKSIKLINDQRNNIPSDIQGLDYIPYEFDRPEQLINRLQDWFTQMDDKFQNDPYLAGHSLRAKEINLLINNLDTEENHTEYTIWVQKIVQTETEELFAMPYHDSVAVDVPLDYFDLHAFDLQNTDNEGNPVQLSTKHSMSANRMKRFSIVMGKMELEEIRHFSVILKERQLFDQEENEDWYEVNIIYPTEFLNITININPEWKIKKDRVWVSYGQSMEQSVSELNFLEYDTNRIHASFKRPRIGETYFIRWEWEM